MNSELEQQAPEIEEGMLLEEEVKCPFEDEFRTKWWNVYMQLQNKEHIQRLYNLDKITAEDFKIITGEEPTEKSDSNSPVVVVAKRTKMVEEEASMLMLDVMMKEERISSVESENANLVFSDFMKDMKLADMESENSMLIMSVMDNAIKIMDLESQLAEVKAMLDELIK